MSVQSAKSAGHFSQHFLTGSVSMPRSLLYPFRPRMHFPNQRLTFGAGLHQALHPLPARNDWGEDRGEGKPIKTHLLSPALSSIRWRRRRNRGASCSPAPAGLSPTQPQSAVKIPASPTCNLQLVASEPPPVAAPPPHSPS